MGAGAGVGRHSAMASTGPGLTTGGRTTGAGPTAANATHVGNVRP